MRLGLILLTFAAVARPAGATTMVPLDLRALSERADRVVLGVAVSQTASWTASHDAIYTEVTVRVSRVYKGTLKPGDLLVVRREGGSVDGIGMRVFGAAEFTVGEEALIFAERRGGATWVTGMAQGKLRVTIENGRKMVAPRLGELHFTAAAPSSAPRPLEDVEREVLAYVAAQRAVK